MAATAAPACFVLSACEELLLAPGWLFANVNLPQPLLLISQSCWIPLGAVTRGGKVPFSSERVALALGWSSVPIPSLWLLSGSPFSTWSSAQALLCPDFIICPFSLVAQQCPALHQCLTGGMVLLAELFQVVLMESPAPKV